jgi:Flp pilus assembly pilin Flp
MPKAIQRVQALLASKLRSVRHKESGQALVEYALILSLIAIVSVTVLAALGHNVSNILHTIGTRI